MRLNIKFIDIVLILFSAYLLVGWLVFRFKYNDAGNVFDGSLCVFYYQSALWLLLACLSYKDNRDWFKVTMTVLSVFFWVNNLYSTIAEYAFSNDEKIWFIVGLILMGSTFIGEYLYVQLKNEWY